MNHDIKLVSSKLIYRDTHIGVIQDVLEHDAFQWNQVYLQWNNKNAVCVIPYEKGGVHLIQQYRHASRRNYWQFPGGIMESHVSSRGMAKRELMEETGFEAKRIIKVGCISPEPGLTTVKIDVFVATGLKMKKRHLEKSEIGMKMKFYTLHNLEKKIRKGYINCGITISAFYLFNLCLKGDMY